MRCKFRAHPCLALYARDRSDVLVITSLNQNRIPVNSDIDGKYMTSGETVSKISNLTEQRFNVLNGQPGVFLISISHISPSGAKRRRLLGFIPALERALATISSHNDRNKGRPNSRSKHKTRMKKLDKV